MVEFSVFNELSFKDIDISNNTEVKNKFKSFFEVLNELKNRGLTSIRMDEDFKNYEISPDITFYQFFNEIEDRDFKERLIQFITMDIIKIDSPLIKDEEIENHTEAIENEYSYNAQSTFGGLACCDIWNTIAVSFNSSDEWNKSVIILQKNAIDINIRHASMVEHLNIFEDFFKDLEEYKKLAITQKNLWERREEIFPNKIIFTKEIEKEIKNIDKVVFEQSIDILYDVESNKKNITDYNHSGESKSVKDDDNLKKYRYFTIDDEKVFFENHIKSLPNANRIYFLEQDNKVYIGYIGKHLPTKKY